MWISEKGEAAKQERSHQIMRGQTLPFQIISLLVLLSISFFLLDFAYIFHAEAQAQNDADAAAQLAVIPQANQFNELSLALYSAAIEEYRVRHLFNSLLMNVRGVGGCDAQPDAPIRSGTYQTDLNCDDNYPELRSELFESVNRYTNDVLLVDSIANVTTGAQQQSAQNAITTLQKSCSTAGDCNVKYMLVKFQPRKNLANASESATQYTFSGYDNGATATVNPILAPEIADVAVCEMVKPLLPNLFGKPFHPIPVVARSAATPITTTQEWFTPGRIIDETSAAASPGSSYNVNEYYVPYLTVDGTGWDWNNVPFWGYDAKVAANSSRTRKYEYIADSELGQFAAYASWWTTSLIHTLALTSADLANFKQQLASNGCS